MKKILFAAAALFALAGCVEDEIFPYAAIADLDYTYAYDADTPVEVTVTVNSFVDLTGYTLYYTVEGGSEKAVTMTEVSDGVYTATIPAMAMGTNVSYYVVVSTEAGDTKSAVTKYTVGVTPPNWAAIQINELNGNDKFIELVNTGGADVDIEGMYITKDGGESATWTAPKKTLAPGGLLLLYSEDVVISGGAQEGYDATLVFASGLSAKKNVRIQLFNPSGKCVDDFNITKHPGTKVAGSYGLNADGKWYKQNPTPGAANEDGTDSVEDWF